jgi:hypothetical protein
VNDIALFYLGMKNPGLAHAARGGVPVSVKKSDHFFPYNFVKQLLQHGFSYVGGFFAITSPH